MEYGTLLLASSLHQRFSTILSRLAHQFPSLSYSDHCNLTLSDASPVENPHSCKNVQCQVEETCPHGAASANAELNSHRIFREWSPKVFVRDPRRHRPSWHQGRREESQPGRWSLRLPSSLLTLVSVNLPFPRTLFIDYVQPSPQLSLRPRHLGVPLSPLPQSPSPHPLSEPQYQPERVLFELFLPLSLFIFHSHPVSFITVTPLPEHDFHHWTFTPHPWSRPPQ